MDYDELYERNAQDSYAREMESIREASELLNDATDYDTARESVEEAYGTPLDVETGQVVKILLTTGGPARGYYIFLDSDNEPDSAFYWFQDWNHTKRVFWLDTYQTQQVLQVYDVYTGN